MRVTKNLSLIFCIVFTVNNCLAQMAIEWQNCVGTANGEIGYGIVQTKDSGFAVCGLSMTQNVNSKDFYIGKVDKYGTYQWQKTYGGTADDWATSIVETDDNGLIVGGFTESNDLDVSGNHGSRDYWVIKLDSVGDLKWQKCYGGGGYDEGISVAKSTDGGFFMTGYSWSNNGDVSGNHGSADIWVIKIDTAGTIIWQKSVGGSDFDCASSIVGTPDGGCALMGFTRSVNGDFSISYGQTDYCAVKLDSAGNVQWAESYGGGGTEWGRCINRTNDNGYILCGHTRSGNSGLVTGGHGWEDYWVVKIDSLGAFEWQKALGGSDYDWGYCVIQEPSGDYLVCGQTDYADGDISTTYGNSDIWIVKLDSVGNIVWDKSIGSSHYEDVGFSIIHTFDGSYAIAGNCNGSNGDVMCNNAGADVWVVKFTDVVNQATGKIFVDLNNNMIKDSAEALIPYKKVTEQITGRFSIADYNGEYNISVLDTGNFNVTADSIKYFNCVPNSHSVNFSGLNQIDSLLDFAFQPSGNINDLSITVTPILPFSPGFNATYYISYKNIGTTILQPEIIFKRSASVTYLSSSVLPTTIIGDTVKWTLDSISPYQQGNILVTFGISVGQPLGSLINSTAWVKPDAQDANVSDNVVLSQVTVTGSFDPNSKSVDDNLIYTYQLSSPQYLYYMINFQNTGTAPAITVEVRDNLSAFLDISTFELLGTSHTATTTYGAHSRLLSFKFDNINLPDSLSNEPASHGWIKYRIKPLSNLNAGNNIVNNALIYFDYNYPVQTNNAVTNILLYTTYATLNVTECDSFLSPSGNYLWTSSGTYIDTIPNYLAGDSIITINLAINSSSSIINVNSCDSYVSPSGNYSWTSSGIYTDTIPTALGCDSIITINLTLNNSSTSIINASSCGSFTSPSGNYLWTLSGTYTDTIPNVVGCDSVITINLSVTILDTSIAYIFPYLFSNATGVSYQWAYCDSVLIAGANSQSYTPTANGLYLVIVSQNGCTDTSSCYPILNTAIPEIAFNKGIVIFPNPSNGNIRILYLLPKNQKGIFEIFDVTGKKVFSFNLPQLSTMQSFSLPYLSNGVYNCVITSAGERVSKKFAVIRE